jgi:hypothetical protein
MCDIFCLITGIKQFVVFFASNFAVLIGVSYKPEIMAAILIFIVWHNC